jgi:hypothetical protein
MSSSQTPWQRSDRLVSSLVSSIVSSTPNVSKLLGRLWFYCQLLEKAAIPVLFTWFVDWDGEAPAIRQKTFRSDTQNQPQPDSSLWHSKKWRRDNFTCICTYNLPNTKYRPLERRNSHTSHSNYLCAAGSSGDDCTRRCASRQAISSINRSIKKVIYFSTMLICNMLI